MSDGERRRPRRGQRCHDRTPLPEQRNLFESPPSESADVRPGVAPPRTQIDDPPQKPIDAVVAFDAIASRNPRTPQSGSPQVAATDPRLPLSVWRDLLPLLREMARVTEQGTGADPSGDGK